ncbi:hypothetical protein N7468_001800 [Penicillium chermesinum]|uniref:Uncharacterized protein n=1 Tax=Penicillium chermesinum TaxID=63820 RepID=A0A9W9TXE6_9EURO|nr:uncharacterized protein N7468_001800 [Penicillium chermesinum]KAJ5246817.1 hypothetical protein N7468_001800 [Penicillium chermesinum]
MSDSQLAVSVPDFHGNYDVRILEPQPSRLAFSARLPWNLLFTRIQDLSIDPCTPYGLYATADKYATLQSSEARHPLEEPRSR